MLKRNVQMIITLSLGIAFSIVGGFIPWFFIPATLFILVFSWLIFFNAHALNKENADISQLKAQIDDMKGQLAGLSMMVGGRR